MPVVTDFTALLSGSYWNGIEVTGKPVIVTYSFPTIATSYMADVDGFTTATVASFQAFNSAEQTQARAALGEWAAASGLVFVEVAPGQGDINFQLVDFNTTSSPSYAGAGGIAFYPFGNWDFFTYPSFSSDLDASGDVFMNSQFVSGGQVAYGTLLHEIGHAIGLKHPMEVVTNFAANPDVTHDQVLATDDPSVTIMAETGGVGVPEHLKAFDQQAAAFLYGAAGTGQVVTGNASGANTVVSSWSWNASKQVLTQIGSAGSDSIRGSSVRDLVSGLSGDDKLFGLNGNDTLNGGDGNDLLNGGPGIDTMTGGVGDDTYMVDDSKDKTIELANEGADSVLSSVSFTLAANLEVLRLFGAGLTGRGNSLGNSMFGDGSGASQLYGLDGDDYMGAGSNNDTLDGGAGADLMFGGGGYDKYYVDNAGDVVNEAAGAGTDTVFASVSWTMGVGQHIEYLRAQGVASASGITLTGNELANQLFGGAGNDHLNGGAGLDQLDGGAGADVMAGGGDNDKYYVDNTNDAVNEAAGGGTDTVFASVSWAMVAGQQIEYLRAQGAAAASGISLTGNEFANQLFGGAGSDHLNGGAGLDQLDGGAGADVMAGGGDNDVYYVDNANDAVNEAAGGGSDTVFASVSWTMAAGQQIEYLRAISTAGITLTGNELANDLFGGAGNDHLNGGVGADQLDGRAGADVMAGGGNNDKYYVDNANDTVNEAAGGGTDTVFASVSWAMAAGQQIEYLRANSTAGITLTGNELANQLFGGAGADVIRGGGGNDKLMGGGAVDTFVFGAGSGVDTVLDFVTGGDLIDVSAYHFADFDSLMAAATDVGASTVIALGPSDSITIAGILKAQFSEADFLL